jgi:hypothetical protein
MITLTSRPQGLGIASLTTLANANANAMTSKSAARVMRRYCGIALKGFKEFPVYGKVKTTIPINLTYY